jgi:hypothetical protein
MFIVIDETVVIDFKPRVVSPSHTDTATVVAERVVKDTDARIVTAESQMPHEQSSIRLSLIVTFSSP